MTGPDVTVVMPVRNGAATIDAQLRALRAQRTEFPWELLVSDNGSTDDTVRIVESYASSMDVRVVDSSARRGPAAARNIAAGHARAGLLAFCDADDQAEPDWLSRMRRALDEASIACGGWEGALLNRSSRFALSWSPTSEYRKDYLPALPAGAGNNMAVRAEAFHAVGGFDESMLTAEDIDLAWRVQLAGGEFVFVADAIMHVRRRDGVRSLWQQATSYGRGEFRLRHKYAKVIEAYRAAARDGAQGTQDADDATDAASPDRRDVGMLRRFIRGGGRLHLPDRLWRVGMRRGERRAVADPSWTVVEPPASLPYH